MDIASIGAALSSIKTAADLAKILKDSNSSLGQAEVNFKLADLVGALADAKMDIASIKELLIEKEQEILELKKSLETKDNIKWEKPYYFLQTDDSKEGPYCQTCYDNDKKLIRLQDGSNGAWRCHVCTGYFEDSSYRPIDIESPGQW
tara:strand:- start:210 stop:650 length:441 start_codon:yes stop_codon:yes gene_type:complete